MRLNEHANTSVDYRCARDLRNNASPAEKKLWAALREVATVKNLKFRRQQVVHPFIVDFACMQARLLIELDGASHDARVGYDVMRDEDLKRRGFFILRFSNEDVVKNTAGVVITIIDHAERLIQNAD